MFRLICVEGINGAGKSTLINKLLKSDLGEKLEFTTRRLPRSPFVEKMYNIIHEYKSSFQPLELFVDDLYFRYSILPKNKFILSDRSFISAHVFYNVVSKLMRKEKSSLLRKIEIGIEKFKPEIIIFLKIEPHIAYQRLKVKQESNLMRSDFEFLSLCSQEYARVMPFYSKLFKILEFDSSKLNESNLFKIVSTYLKEYVCGDDY